MSEKIPRYTAFDLSTFRFEPGDAFCRYADVRPLEARIVELEEEIEIRKKSQEHANYIMADRMKRIIEMEAKIERLERELVEALDQ